MRNLPYPAGLARADDCEGEAQLDILVDGDQYWDLVTGGIIGGEAGTTVTHPKLGWIVSGQVPSSSTTINLTGTYVLKCQVRNHPDLDLLESKLKRFWRLESLGIVPMKGVFMITSQNGYTMIARGTMSTFSRTSQTLCCSVGVGGLVSVNKDGVGRTTRSHFNKEFRQ